jgi:RNA polymerase sigma-70 factor (ECF subfamily)
MMVSQLDPDSNMAENNDTLDPATWVDAYGNFLYRFALARLKDPAVAEDVLQETFLAALKGRDRFKHQSSVKTWLTAILKHKIIDHLRKKKREQTVEDIETISDAVDSHYRTGGHWKIRPAKWDLNPLKAYEQREFMDIFYTCIAELPKRLARLFMLREMEGLSTEEICNSMEISATNSWVMLYRARAHLRRCLEIKWFDPSEAPNP